MILFIVTVIREHFSDPDQPDGLPEGSPGGPRHAMILFIVLVIVVVFWPRSARWAFRGVPRRHQEHYDFTIVIVIVVHFLAQISQMSFQRGPQDGPGTL